MKADKKTLLILIIFLWFLGKNHSAIADFSYQYSGFGTIGGTYMDDDAINEANAFPHNGFDEGMQYDIDSRLALQGSIYYKDLLDLTAQLVSSSEDNGDVEVEWAYLSYRLDESFTVRLGRLRAPLYYHSEYLPVGYAYTWIRPPSEVYSSISRYGDSFDGISLFYKSAINSWDLSTELYYGRRSGDIEVFNETVDFETPGGFGAAFFIEKNNVTFRLAYTEISEVDSEASSEGEFLLDSLRSAGFAEVANGLDTQNFRTQYYNIGFLIDNENWLLNSEYVYIPIIENLAPGESSWYVMGGRRFGNYTLHLTYSELKRRNENTFGKPINETIAFLETVSPANPLIPALGLLSNGVDEAIDRTTAEQKSYTLGLRYDFTFPAALKFEYQHIIDSKNSLDSNLYSVAIDFLF